ncbi:MAG: chorismate pyruvate-lyase family protein [Pseudomonadota bacterium]
MKSELIAPSRLREKSAIPDCQIPDALAPILGAHMEADGLSDIERIMLACDGTFTFQLEAFMREPVEVDILDYELRPAGEKPAAILDAEAGASMWERKVLLRGAKTGTPFVFAHSFIDVDRLPAALARDLEASPAGIGRLFVDYRLSIYRELVGYFFEDGSNYAPFFPDREQLSFLARVYRVTFHGRPVMLITEKMPRDLFSTSVTI